MQLPDRYQRPWRAEFEKRVNERLRPGLQVLDVGGGATPTLAPADRPEDIRYVGFDLAESELDRAGPGVYDDKIEADISAEPREDLASRFDLIVSFQVLEHVRPLERAFANLHRYLRPGGELVVQFSTLWTPFGIANRLLPHALGAGLLTRITPRRRASVFPAYYDRCYASAVRKLLSHWQDVSITPLYYGAAYFASVRPLQRLYVAYENWACAGGRENLAPYLVVTARRPRE